jgi:hypothetical protein
VKAVRVAMIASVVMLGTACSLWSKPEEKMTSAELLTLPTNSFQTELKSAQQKEVSAGVRKVATREAFEKLQKEYKDAGDKEKPAKATLLAAAQADYLYAQSAYAEAKRELRLAKETYIRKLILDKHPELAFTATPAPETPASVKEQEEEEQIIGVQHGDY